MEQTEYAVPVQGAGKYLFCYFTGNEPEKEAVHFAVSQDGYHFEPLHQNKPVIHQTLGTKSMRDPFLFRGQDGVFYIVATDMRSADGWFSNHAMVCWHSEDLVHWTGETRLDFSRFPETATADRVWAPQALFDRQKGAYMLYWSHHNAGDTKPTAIWYAYTQDFKQLSSAPAVLFCAPGGRDAIDADIVERDGRYFLYYKDELEKTICCAAAGSPSGPYQIAAPKKVACVDAHVEGNCMYRLGDTGTWLMLLDRYTENCYFMQQTEDMLHFKPVCPSDYNLNFTPRHGSVLAIQDAEYTRLVTYFGK